MTLEKIKPLVLSVALLSILVIKTLRDRTDIGDEDTWTFIIEIILESSLLFAMCWDAFVVI